MANQTAVQMALNPMIKAQPTLSDVHVNKLLTNMVVANFQSEAAFIATKVFPSVPVDKQANTYPVWNADDFNRNVMRKRAPSTETAGGNIAPTTGTYFCQVYGFHIDIDDQLKANYDVEFRHEQGVAKFLALVDLICREVAWTSAYFTSGVWDTDLTGGTDFAQWNDDSSTPIKDIKNKKRDMLEATGYKPNTLVMGAEVYDALTLHPEILDRIKYGQTSGGPAQATKDTIKALLEIEDLYVMESIQNTTKEGQTASTSFIAGKNALLTYVNKSGLVMMPSAGYTFNWVGYTGAGGNGSRTKTIRAELIGSDRQEIEAAWDMKQVSSALGCMFNDAADMSDTSLT